MLIARVLVWGSYANTPREAYPSSTLESRQTASSEEGTGRHRCYTGLHVVFHSALLLAEQFCTERECLRAHEYVKVR